MKLTKDKFAIEGWCGMLIDKHWLGNRLVVLVFVLLVACPVVLVAALNYEKTDKELTDSVLSRKQAVVALAAITLREKLDRLTDLGTSLATRVQFRRLVEDGKWQDAIKIVASVPADFPFIERLFITDMNGTLMGDIPELPGGRGNNFAHRDWYQGVAATQKPYISEVYRRAAKPQLNVIAQATPITNDSGDMVGILVLQIRTATFLAWIRTIDPGSYGVLYVVDRHGNSIAHPRGVADAKIIDFSHLGAVRKALQGQRGVDVGIGGEQEADQVVAYEPIPGYGWGVIFEQPQSSAFELRNNSLRRLLIAYLLVVLATVCVACVIIRALNYRRRGEEKFRDLFEAAPDGLVMSDEDGKIVLVNAQVEELFGYRRGELIGKSVEILMPERFRTQHPGHRRVFVRQGRSRPMHAGLDLYGLRKDGSEFPVGISLSPLRTEAGILVISSIRDVTDRKRLSEQLQLKNEMLEAQNREIQRANRMKSEFLANMSHELRTPLNAIIGFAELMHDGKLGPVSGQHKEYLGDILGSARHLLQLINDVLDLAKVESGRLEFFAEPVNLRKLIDEVRHVLQALSASKRLAVEVEVAADLERLIIDPAKLKQVLYNYLSNAIKFTPEQGRIRVRAMAEGSEHFRLEVEDTGIGICPEEMGKLFVEFQQLETATTKKYQGTGLGLALTKKIVEAQGGHVGAQSTAGRGSVFYAVLPRFAQSGAKTKVQDRHPARTKDAPRVLLIEDSEYDRIWLTKTLADSGYAVECAMTGAEGIAKAQAQAYHAILLDLILPDMGGWDVLHDIRAKGPNELAPVIVITLIAEKGVAKGFPVQDFLVKPFEPDTLLNSLERAGVRTKSPRQRVLIVDDDHSTLKMAKAALHSSGYDPVCHDSGEKGLNAASQSEFSAVVLDLLMPEIDGFEFLDRFREIDNCRNTPVIVWTCKEITSGDRERLKQSAQSVAFKGREGVDVVLRELQRHLEPRGDHAPPRVESVVS